VRKADRIKKVQQRVARAEADCNATVLRAFDRLMRVLERERTECLIRIDRERKRVTRR